MEQVYFVFLEFNSWCQQIFFLSFSFRRTHGNLLR